MICEKVEMQMADIVGMEESIRHVLKKMEDKNLSIIPVVQMVQMHQNKSDQTDW